MRCSVTISSFTKAFLPRRLATSGLGVSLARRVPVRVQRLRAASEEAATEPTEVPVSETPKVVPQEASPAPPATSGNDRFDQVGMVEELFNSSEFGTRGEGWVAAQFATFAVILAAPTPLTSLIDSLAALGVLVGGIGLVYSVFNIGRNLTPLPTPRKEHELVTSGIYRYARHPMYGGALLLCLGFAVLTHSETRLAAVAVLWWILEQKVTLEEEALSARYPEYAEYKTKVKKLIPFIY